MAGAVTTSAIESQNELVGFQGDFTFDSRVVTFANEPAQKAGLTEGNWNVSANILEGAGPIRTLRVSGYSTDFRPLSGKGTLFKLNMIPLGKDGQTCSLNWKPAADAFIFIDANLQTQRPGNAAAGRFELK